MTGQRQLATQSATLSSNGHSQGAVIRRLRCGWQRDRDARAQGISAWFRSQATEASRESALANLQCFSANCLMKTIVAFIVGLLISTAAWAQVDHTNGIV